MQTSHEEHGDAEGEWTTDDERHVHGADVSPAKSRLNCRSTPPIRWHWPNVCPTTKAGGRENGRTKPGKTPGWIGEYPDQIMGDNPNSRGRRSRPVGGWDMRQGWPDRESLSAEKYTVSAGEPLNVRGTVYGLCAEV